MNKVMKEVEEEESGCVFAVSTDPFIAFELQR